MTFTVRPISAAEHLDHLRSRRSASFQQTPAWAAVKTEWHGESLGWYAGERLAGTALVLHRPVPRLGYTLAYVPWGPDIDWADELTLWLTPLATYLRAQGAFAIRLAPPVRTTTWEAAQVKAGIADPAIARLSDLPGRPDPVGVEVARQLRDTGWIPQNPEDGFGVGQPQFTYEIPLRHPDGTARSEDDLLRGMNQQWRRNIKTAAKAGVEVTTSAGGHDLKAFHDLYVHTAERDRFTPRPLAYFERMFTALSAKDSPDGGEQGISLYLARHDGDPVAATIHVRVGGHAWYVYGASSTQKRDVRGSNACQWAMIRDSLAAGCDLYDLRGITPTLASDDPHVGLVRFKAGIGGQAVRYVGEWDLPLRPIVYRAFDLYMRRRGR